MNTVRRRPPIEKNRVDCFDYTTEDGEERRLVVKYGMSYHYGNTDAYFHITADDCRKVGAATYLPESGGCLHDLIRERAPKLAPLIDFHGVSQQGKPMYYMENGLYWARQALGISKWKPQPYDPDPVEAFASTVCLGHGGEFDDGIESIDDAHLTRSDDGDRIAGDEWKQRQEDRLDDIRLWLEMRLDNVKRSFKQTMDEFNIERITVII